MIEKYISIFKDFGPMWTVNRVLYTSKLKILQRFPNIDYIFENEKVETKRLNIFDFDIDSLESFLTGLNCNEKEKIVKNAELAIQGKILAFSSITLDYGNPIDWHKSPLTQKSHDSSKKWYSIPDFDKDVGDIKTIWEISRFTHFLDFARAYILTRDLRYFESYVNQLSDWLENNPYSYGPNYKCGQEATIRMINVLIAYSVFNSYGQINKEQEYMVKKLVADSYKKVYSNFFYAHKCIKNNHTFTEILGRIIGSWCINDEEDLKLSMKYMNKEISDQITNDGGFRQYSNNYHRFILQIFEVLLKIEKKINIEITDKDKINRSVLMLYNTMNKDGFLPNYGSNDGALIFPLSNCDFRDYRPTLNSIYAQLNNKKLLDDGLYSEEMIWFNGSTKSVDSFSRQPLKLDDIGMYTFTNYGSMLMIHLNNLKTRPAHMDQLHIDLWYKEIEIFCDLGTFSYASDLGFELSENYNHNTVSVPGKKQMSKIGAFMVYDWTTIKDVAYELNKKFSGTLKSKNDYMHTRTIEARNRSYEIIDTVNEDEFSVLFHTPLDVRTVSGGVILLYEGKEIVRLETNHNIKITKQFRSLYYFKKEEINKIEILITGEGSAKTRIILAGE